MGFWGDLWDGIVEAFTPATHVLEKHMTEGATKARKPIISGHYVPAKGEVGDEELINYFTKTGYEFKGQVNYGYQTVGGGGSAEASVDVAQFFLPGSPLTAKVGIGGAWKRAPHRLLMLECQGHGRDEYGPVFLARIKDNEEANKALCLSCMLGKWGSRKIQISAEVGAKLSNMLPVPDMECLSFGIEAKVTASGSASYEGTNMIIYDPEPRWYNRERANWKGAVMAFLHEETRAVKADFTKFNPYCSLRLWTQTSEAKAGVGAQAEVSLGSDSPGLNLGGKVGAGISSEIKREARCTTYRIQTPTAAGIISTQDMVITYKQIGGKAIGLSAELELGLAETTKDEDGSTSRDFVSPLDKAGEELKSVSGKVIGSVDIKPLHAVSKVPGKVLKHALLPKEEKGKKEGKFKVKPGVKADFLSSISAKLSLKGERKFEVVNSMSYKTGIAYWTQQDNKLWPGSGYAVGQSASVPNLVRYYSNRDLMKERFTDDLMGFQEPSAKEMDDIIQQTIASLLWNRVQMPSVETWIEVSYIPGWTNPRNKIKGVDNALKNYRNHCDKPTWKGRIAEARAALERNAHGERQQIVKALILEVSERLTLLDEIDKNIKAWLAVRGEDNPRYLAVTGLTQIWEVEMERLVEDHIMRLTALFEYLTMKDYIEGLARALHVSEKNLRTFLDQAQDNFEWAATTPGVKPSAFLIEANFEFPDGLRAGLEINRAVFPPPNNRPDTPYEIGDFQGEFEKRLGMGGANVVYDNLQCLRLRYRIADTENKDRTLFKLGINIKVVKLGITLDRINRAGSEGIFDLYTHWFGKHDQYNTISQGSYPRGCVPPANLLV